VQRDAIAVMFFCIPVMHHMQHVLTAKQGAQQCPCFCNTASCYQLANVVMASASNTECMSSLLIA
jgi:hypothetical protein